jgi:hypothetical protein
MAVDPSVVINIAAEYTGKKAFSKAETATKSLTKGVKGLAGAFGLAFGARGAMQAVKAFAADDKAAKVLSKTLNNLGLAFADPAVTKFISDLERQSGVLDDKLRPAYQMLLTSTGDYIKSQDLLRTALDLSAMSGVDVVSVSADLAKAYQGNTRGLMKYQLGLDKAELAAMSFEEILAEVAKVSAGQAQIAADSYTGSLDKLSVAGANASEILGRDLVTALASLGGADGLPKTLSLIESVAGALGKAIISFSRFIAVLDVITGAGLFKMYGELEKLFKEFDALDAAQRKATSGSGTFSSYNSKKAADALALANAKKITTLTEAQRKAQAKILADKKSQAILDKATLALGKGADVFDMDKIQLNAALIGQAEALGKATTGSQILAIANDVQRLKVKQDINALEDAIASKDTVAIEKATAKLNEDLKILGVLQRQDAKLLDINRVLAGMKSTDLINLANLQAALDLLAKFKFPTLTIPGAVIPTPVIPGLPGAGVGGRGGDAGKGSTFGKSPLDDFLDAVEAETERGGRRGGGIGDTNYVALPPGFNSVDEYLKESRGNRGASDAGTVIVNVNAGAVGDENIIVDAVQNAMNEIARRGYLTTYAGAIAV